MSSQRFAAYASGMSRGSSNSGCLILGPISLVWATLLILAAPAAANDWAFFRGPNNSGVSAESGWTTHWPASGPKVAWKAGVGIGASSVVVNEGHVYCISEKSGGQLMCVDLRSGATVWTERSFARYGTLMIADEKLVILDEKGELVIADATPGGYRELARAKVLSGRCWVMPVLANGRIYARTNKGEMVCLDVRAKFDE